MFMSKLFKGLFEKEVTVEVKDVPEPTPEPERVLVISEPVSSLAESLLILDDWEETLDTSSLHSRYIMTYKHIKHGLEVKAYPSYDYNYTGLNLSSRLINRPQLIAAWMTLDERTFISGVLTRREELQEAARSLRAEQKRIEERNKFFVLVQQPGVSPQQKEI